jgi:hypothetical protein
MLSFYTTFLQQAQRSAVKAPDFLTLITGLFLVEEKVPDNLNPEETSDDKITSSGYFCRPVQSSI